MSEPLLRLHPPFLHFPIAFWISGTALDLAQAAAGLRLPGLDGFGLAHLLLWGGVLFAVPTVGAGLIDYARLAPPVRDGPTLKRHVLCMSAACLAFLGVALWRAKTGAFAAEPSAAMLLFEVLGAAALVVGGHAGGRVVFEELPRHAGDRHRPPR